MPVRDIITIPDSRLRLMSQPVEFIDDGVRRLLDDLVATMYDAQGVGLAAIQIAVPRRAMVVDMRNDNEKAAPLRIINPEIIYTSEELSDYEEGCLSIPDFNAFVERPSHCTVRFLDDLGETRTLECEGLLATVMQHEIDHLNGVLFIDYISKLKRDRIVRKFTKAANLNCKQTVS